MPLKFTSISAERAARRPAEGHSAVTHFQIHRLGIITGSTIQEKKRLGMDHMGIEMLVLDRPPIPIDSGFRRTFIRWYSIFHAFQPSFSSLRTR
jgi:hypothetical protein